MSNTRPTPTKPTKTSINFIITSDERRHYDSLINAGNDYYSDGLPVELYCSILNSVCNAVDEWNQQHK